MKRRINVCNIKRLVITLQEAQMNCLNALQGEGESEGGGIGFPFHMPLTAISLKLPMFSCTLLMIRTQKFVSGCETETLD